MTIVVSYKRKTLQALLDVLRQEGVETPFINEKDRTVVISTTDSVLLAKVRGYGFAVLTNAP